jgi:hypothetical protein
VRYFLAIIYGAVAAVPAILLHQTLPPWGVVVGLIFSYCSIWLVGRRFGSRKVKFVAALAWIAIIFRASTYGAGQELLVQGDDVGATLLLLGTLVVLLAVAARS